MKKTSRRSFLSMLGIGAAATQIGPAPPGSNQEAQDARESIEQAYKRVLAEIGVNNAAINKLYDKQVSIASNQKRLEDRRRRFMERVKNECAEVKRKAEDDFIRRWVDEQ